MKKAKKLFAALFAVVMVLSVMAVPAFAAQEVSVGTGSGSITISNATMGETYKIYKVFDLTYAGDPEGTGTGPDSVAYTFTKTAANTELYNALAGGSSPFKLTEIATDKYTVTLNDQYTTTGNPTPHEASGAEIGEWLKDNEAKLGTETAKASPATDTTVTFSNLSYGYYYVTSSLGSVVTVDSAMKDVTITDKNTQPTVTKAVNKTTASIGDEVTFTITLVVPASVDKPVVIHDKMESGLTLVGGSFTVKDETDADVTYTNVDPKTHADCTFELSFNAADVKGKTVTITYKATLNKNAEISTDTNSNTAWLTYSNFKSEDQTVSVSTFSFDLVKTDNSNKILSGAEFKLYSDSACTQEIGLVAVGDDYRVADATETGDATITAGNVTISGLGNGTYYLKETKAPTGYNELTAAKDFTIDNANLDATVSGDTWTDGGVHVINQAGTELPSTGGIGTTIFYVVGGVLVVAAVVLLVTKKRMSGEK